MGIKNILIELDIGRDVTTWVNEASGVWKVNMDALYPGIEPLLLNGYDTINIQSVGSVKEDGSAMNFLDSVAAVKLNPGSFYFDALNKNLYLQYTDRNDPATHKTLVGAVFGFSNIAQSWNELTYLARISSQSSLVQSKDPLFFGKIAFQSASFDITNTDGAYDDFGEQNNTFGNDVRILYAEDPTSFSDFQQVYHGYIENISINQTAMTVQSQDKRKQLSTSIPPNIYDTTTYPNLNPDNENAPIPLGWGTILKQPAICINENESGPLPTHYDFLFVDTEFHSIKSLGPVYVEGVVKIPTATSLTAGTFQLAIADYTAGNKVSVDYVGYVDGSGVEIENALDVARDIFGNYTTFSFNNSIFNVGEWTVARNKVSDIGIAITERTQINEILEEVSKSAQAEIWVQVDARWTAKAFDVNDPSLQTLIKTELLAVPRITYDSDQFVTGVDVSYAQNLEEGDYKIYLKKDDDLREENKAENIEPFTTLLTNVTDAETFADTVLEISGGVRKLITAEFKMQLIDRKIGEFITLPMWRATNQMLPDAKVEIISLQFDPEGFKITVVGRVLEFITPTTIQPADTWGGTYWGGGYWGERKVIPIT